MQHVRLPCPSLSPRVCSTNSCWWCHPTISFSVVPFSPCLLSFPASRCFPVSQFLASGGQSIETSDITPGLSRQKWPFSSLSLTEIYLHILRAVASGYGLKDGQQGQNQSILMDMNTEYSLEGRMLKLKLQYFDVKLQYSDMKSWLIGKDPDAGKKEDWGQEVKRPTEDEMVGWHHWLNGQESEQTQGNSKRQGSLACCSSRGHKESDMT